MKNTQKLAAAVAAVVSLGAVALVGTSVSAQTPPVPGMNRAERHPELRRALMSLERTEYQLRHSARDFGGHREKAADLCHQAQQEVQLALQYDKN